MTTLDHPDEHHYIHRVGWLRAAVLGANDGILSTASLVIGVASASASTHEVLVAGTAGLVAGALSMAAGEFVSVSSQSDTEKADLATEAAAIEADPEAETRELAGIYRSRGLDADLAMQVARQLMAKDPLAAHARDELGILELTTARPLQAAISSAISFAIGAALPLLAALFAPQTHLTWIVGCVSLLALVVLGMLSAWAGGASKLRAAVRLLFWGVLAMVATGLIGQLFGTVIA